MKHIHQNGDGFNEFLDDFKDKVKANIDNIKSRNPDIFNKIQEQRDKLNRADFDEDRKEVEEYAKNGMRLFKGRLSRWYTKYGRQQLAIESERNAILKDGIQTVQVLAYFYLKDLYEATSGSKDNKGEQPKTEKEGDPIKSVDSRRGFTANEHALAYLFDLYANGGNVPINSREGGLNATLLRRMSVDKGFSRDSFYKSVKDLPRRYNLNIKNDLSQISLRWLIAVKELSSDWQKVRQYLTEKNLIDQ